MLYLASTILFPLQSALAEKEQLEADAELIVEETINTKVEQIGSLVDDGYERMSGGAPGNSVDESRSPAAIGASGGSATDGFVDLASGQARYSIPVSVLPGRAGLAPQVSLNYTSTIENGFVGVGWSLSAGGSIRRFKDRFGVPQYDETDIYSLSSNIGGGELVLDPENLDGDHFVTKQDALIKIERNTSTNTWTAKTRSGFVYTFGGSSNAIVTRSNNTFDETNEWLLIQIRDLFNVSNTIDFTWIIEDGETPRLDRIDYSGRAVEFSYIDREDKRIYFNRGFKTGISKLLQEIRVLVPDDTDEIPENNLSSGFRLIYNGDGKSPAGESGTISQSFLTTLEPLGANYAETNTPPWHFEYTIKEPGWTLNPDYEPNNPYLTWEMNYYFPYDDEHICLQYCDPLTLPGDPLCDEDWCREAVFWREAWNGNRFHDHGLTYIDLSGDGIPELVEPDREHNEGGFFEDAFTRDVRFYGGWAEYYSEVWLPYSYAANSGIGFSDVNGDARLDGLISLHKYNNGTGEDFVTKAFLTNLGSSNGIAEFEPSETDADLPFLTAGYLNWQLAVPMPPPADDDITVHFRFVAQPNYGGLYLDVNQDGLLDGLKVCRFGTMNHPDCQGVDNGIYIGDGTLSNWDFISHVDSVPPSLLMAEGTLGLTHVEYERITPYDEHPGHYIDYVKTKAHKVGVNDVNGDGLPDILAYKRRGYWFWDGAVYYGHGYKFDDASTGWAEIPEGMNGYAVFSYGIYHHMGDFNNDGLVDYLTSDGLYHNTGRGWAVNPNVDYDPPLQFLGTSQPERNKTRGTRVVDINGDGILDLLQSADFDYTCLGDVQGRCPDDKILRYAYIGNGPYPGLLSKMTMPTSGTVNFTYEASSNQDIHIMSGGSHQLPAVRQLLKSVEIKAGATRESLSEFRYFDGRLDEKARFAGFERVEITNNSDDSNAKRVRDVWYNNSIEEYYGSLEYEVVSLGGCPDDLDPVNYTNLSACDHPVSWTANSYLDDSSSEPPYWAPLTTSTAHRFYNGNVNASIETINESEYDLARKVKDIKKSYGSDHPNPGIVEYEYASNSSLELVLPCLTETFAADQNGNKVGSALLTEESYYPGADSVVCQGSPTYPVITHTKRISNTAETGTEVREEYYKYDLNNGNLECISSEELTQCSNATNGAKTVFSYESDYNVLVNQVETPNGDITTTQYDNYLRPALVTAPTGVVTMKFYDALGREQFRTVGANLVSETQYASDARSVTKVLYLDEYDGFNLGYEKTYVDEIGREWYTESWFEQDQRKKCSGKIFDRAGRVVEASVPAFGSECDTDFNPLEHPRTTTTYRDDGYLESVLAPNGALTEYDYSFVEKNGRTHEKTLITNPIGVLERSHIKDALGRTVAVVEEALEGSPESSFGYDNFGNLTSYTDNDSNQSNTIYNAFSEKRFEDDPDRSNCDETDDCRWGNAYNSHGLLESVTDARAAMGQNEATVYHYDKIGNLRCLDVFPHSTSGANGCDCDTELDRADHDPSGRANSLAGLQDTCLQYGISGFSTGKLEKAVNAHGVFLYSYDEFGNISQRTQWICLPRNADPEGGSPDYQVLCRELQQDSIYSASGQLLEHKLTFADEDPGDGIDPYRTIKYTYGPRGRVTNVSIEKEVNGNS